MILEDFHTHTNFSDGRDTPAEMAAAALSRGMARLGISDHSFTAFDPDGGCMRSERYAEYRETLAALKEEYRGRLDIFCGIEQDFYSEIPPEGFDYVIGCVHFLEKGGGYYCIDNKIETLRFLIGTFYGGDPYGMVEEYFRTVAGVVGRTGCDLIGHFDLIAKLNEKYPLFDERHPRYVAAWRQAADALLKTGRPFEINTGGIARGWRSVPYPAPEIQRYLAHRGARFVLSSDSHRADTLCFDFERQEAAGPELIHFPI